MKRAILSLILAGILLLSACAGVEPKKSGDIATEPETETVTAGEFSFADLKNIEFFFQSGVGGWRTTLHIAPDGRFSGVFYDSDLGDIGEGYPNGVVYRCDFNGQFTQPEKVNEYTYSVKIIDMNYDQEENTEEIKDGTLYRYSGAYGLEDAENIMIYLPGAPTSELPEDFRLWIRYYDLSNAPEKLPFYALNIEAQQFGFTSSYISEYIREMLKMREDMAQPLENSLISGLLTQTEMNETSSKICEVWYEALDEILYYLKLIKSDEEMNPIIEEQSAWIAKKHQEVEAAGAEFEGGTMQPLIMNDTDAEMTKARAYELMELFD